MAEIVLQTVLIPGRYCDRVGPHTHDLATGVQRTFAAIVDSRLHRPRSDRNCHHLALTHLSLSRECSLAGLSASHRRQAKMQRPRSEQSR